MYLIPQAQAERFPRPYGETTWGSVFGALGVLARASPTVRNVLPNLRSAICGLEDACHARYVAATGRSVRSESDRILAWAIARIDHPEGDLDDAHVFASYDDMVTRRPNPEGEPVRPLVPESFELRTVLDLGDGTRWAAVECPEHAIAVGDVAYCDLADIDSFRRAKVPEGRAVYVLADGHAPLWSASVLAMTSTLPGETTTVQGLTVDVDDPLQSHADAVQALSDHLGVTFEHPRAPRP